MKPRSSLPFCVLAVAVAALASCGGESRDLRWWKGNLHTHSLWSDGDDYPEAIVGWYKDQGYDFVALSDHNTLAEGDRWIDVAASAGGMVAFEDYLEKFGTDWVEQRQDNGTLLARLKTLEEYRVLFEEVGGFLLIQSEEITDRFESKPIHVNATNIAELIEPQGGGSVREVMQNNVDAVLDQRRRTGQAMFPHINHPNFGWAIKVEDLIALEGERFFEVYNGHPAVNNYGDDDRPSTERMWDILLAQRLSGGAEMMYGIAVDDAHHYRDLDSAHANPGRGWVMVRSARLAPDDLIAAMEAGDFYGSSGVVLTDIRVADAAIAIDIQQEDGVTYNTQFIGTRSGYAPAIPLDNPDPDAPVALQYSEDIGIVLAEVAGPSPSYTFVGDELYVRAKIISSKVKTNPYKAGEVEVAWTQPIIPIR
ncbi:MAG: histidinol-phosphatase [Gemmatimonadetes bacterium]|nr:histidinol-phosphatase [Gemmatimonadota bacterium]